MCGIWGIIEYNPILSNIYLKSYNNVKNRGPDNSYIHIDKNYIIGFHRLAINDLTIFGNQPFYYTDNIYNYILIVNGEIYNYKELKNEYDININSNSDCSIILPLFIKINKNFNKLNNLLRGEYSMVLIKQNIINFELEYFFSTDPLSVRPLFYFIDEYKIGFSSILNGLSNISDKIKRLNQGSYIQGSTDFSSYNNYNIIKYHNYDLIKYPIDIDINILYNKIIKILTESINIRLHSDRPLGCLLSGGLDSSIIAAIASNELKKRGSKLKTFSIGMHGGSDLEYAKIVSEHIDSEHTEFIFTIAEGIEAIDNVIKATETYDITTIRASVGQYLIAKKISENTNIKVLLNGDGADECQMGYIYFYMYPNIEAAILERDKLLNQIHYFDGLRVDRNLSYFGLEARVPYLDKEFVNLYKKIPGELLVPRFNEKIEKFLIRNAISIILPRLLPNNILWRKKEAFSDGISSNENSWYQILKNHFNNLISDEEFHNNQFDYIKPLCKESYYYRKKFNDYFGNNHSVIPRYWMPNWINNNDPSARTLNIYNSI